MNKNHPALIRLSRECGVPVSRFALVLKRNRYAKPVPAKTGTVTVPAKRGR